MKLEDLFLKTENITIPDSPYRNSFIIPIYPRLLELPEDIRSNKEIAYQVLPEAKKLVKDFLKESDKKIDNAFNCINVYYNSSLRLILEFSWGQHFLYPTKNVPFHITAIKNFGLHESYASPEQLAYIPKNLTRDAFYFKEWVILYHNKLLEFLFNR